MANSQAHHNRTWGEKFEEAVEDAFPIYLERSTHYDARTEVGGLPVQIKGCQPWIANGYTSNGNPKRTRGRWRLWEEDHAYLSANSGVYILGLYDPSEDDPLIHAQSYPWNDERLQACLDWREIKHRDKSGPACRVNWTEMLSEGVVDA